jgi:uncharacterized membrane protein YvbJ
LVTCPNCGNSVRESEQFCGNCGTDVHAALAAASHTPPIGEEHDTPYAYSQPTGYGYEYQPPEPAGRSRLVIIGIAIIVVACCMCAAGFLVGLEASCYLPGNNCGIATPVLKPTVTPASWLPIIQYFIG